VVRGCDLLVRGSRQLIWRTNRWPESGGVPYVRTVKTASGATAVQIVYSYHRGSRQIQHLGSAHDGAELELLKAAARQKLAAGQGVLDLGLDTGAPGGPLPITSSRMGCLLDALCPFRAVQAAHCVGPTWRRDHSIGCSPRRGREVSTHVLGLGTRAQEGSSPKPHTGFRCFASEGVAAVVAPGTSALAVRIDRLPAKIEIREAAPAWTFAGNDWHTVDPWQGHLPAADGTRVLRGLVSGALDCAANLVGTRPK
jgi:hypothetical protein